MKADFLIRAQQENVVTEKGVRVFVMERLLNSAFEKASVVNLDEKTVRVQLEGDEKEIRRFKELLEKEMAATFGNPVISFSDIHETIGDIPTLMKSSQALMVAQLQKGITVQLHILDTLNTMKSDLKMLPLEIAKALQQN